MEVEVDSGLEQGYSRESSGNDNTGPTSSRRPTHPPQLQPSSDQPDVVQTSVAVTTVAKDNSASKDCNNSEAKSGNGGDENDYVEYPR